ncbi:MAG: hypothetical protein MPL62_13170 [Alphaproteobacteria bacterium]|nr:hypothetical protein [Alphaproteobacteria bacterium]
MADLPETFEEFDRKISDLFQKKQLEKIISECSARIVTAKKGGQVPLEILAFSHLSRGLAYYDALDPESTQNALNDLHEANNLDIAQVLKRFHPLCYLAAHAKTARALHHIKLIFAVFCRLQDKLVDAPSKSKKIAHYTELRVLKNLARSEPFRLYNVGYMNDPEEGKVFFKVINQVIRKLDPQKQIDIQKLFYSSESKNSYSPAYVGSFVRVEKEENEQKSRNLFLWRTYGKNQGEEGAGACLHFNAGGFSGQSPLMFGHMSLHGTAASEQCIYRVVYENEVESDEELKNYLLCLAEVLIQAEEIDWKDEKDGFYKVVRELLDQIRFLFKSDYYSAEGELRIVQSHYTDKSGRLIARGAVHTDMDSSPPRFFVEVTKSLPLETVILGPVARRFWGWEQWLKQQNSDLEVRKSDIPYGERD